MAVRVPKNGTSSPNWNVERGNRRQQLRAWTPGVRRALVVVCVFFIFQQITGINVRLYYGPHLLGPIFSGAHATLVQRTVAGVEVTSIMTAVNVASTYLGFRWKRSPPPRVAIAWIPAHPGQVGQAQLRGSAVGVTMVP
jgi:hypothetical protein